VSQEGLARLRRYWETLTREQVVAVGAVYADDAYFRDPFNEVRGVEAIARIFDHMYETLDEPRFRITETILEGDAAVLIWDFEFRVKKWKPDVTQRIHGLSHVRFGPDGRVTYHRYYWDAAGELYARLPVVGPLMRYLARRMS
jgi:steroid delta-isomerase